MAIPRDIMRAAFLCGNTVLRNLPDDYGDVSVEIEAIAKVILDERERCAAVAKGWADRIEGAGIAAKIMQGEADPTA